MNEVADVETRAKAMGWQPQSEFRGDPAKWRPAEEYVQRGEELLPIVQASERRLRQENQQLTGKLSALETQLRSAAESIDALKEFNTEATRKVAKEERAKTIAALAEARRNGDTETEVALTDQLEEQRTAIKAAEAAPTSRAASATTGGATAPHPEWSAWVAENSWFNSSDPSDRRRASITAAIANELRADPANSSLQGKAYWDKAAAEADRILGGARREAPDKVNGSRTTGGAGSGTAGKSYADLPAEAKAACEKDVKRLVGPKGSGKAYESADAWRKRYVELYFQE